MKKYIYIFIILLFTYTANSQNLIRAEYFIDEDPGVGNGTAFNLSNPQEIINISDSIAISNTLSGGFHFLCFRFQDADGVWSLSKCVQLIIDKHKVHNKRVPLIAAEYYIDNDPGFGNATSHQLNNPSVAIEEKDSIPIPNLTGGFHKLVVRYKDSLGTWSFPKAYTVLIDKSFKHNDRVPIVLAEYFFDNDPGFGNATQILIEDPSELVTFIDSVLVQNLNGTFSRVGFRFKDSLGLWGITQYKVFVYDKGTYSDRNDTLVAAEYFFDNDPGFGNAIQVPIQNPASVLAYIDSVALANLTGGFHKLGYRFKNNLGVWNITQYKSFFYDKGSYGDDKDTLVAGEYFFNNDPGFGNATAFDIDEPSNTVIILDSLQLVGLEQGINKVCIRVKNKLGIWNITQCLTIVVRKNIDNCSIAAIKYYFDEDTGEQSGGIINNLQNGNPFQAEIPLGDLDLGNHRLIIKAADNCGVWTHNVADTFKVANIQVIPLSQGWNTISAYVDPLDPDMINLNADIVNNVVIVKNNSGMIYLPNIQLNQIGNLLLPKG